jgi:outer membrane immunogenic protein
MRKFLFNSIVLVGLLTGPAMAADLPVKAPIYETPVVAPVYNWAGFYVGGNAGYGWGKVDNNVNLLDTFGGLTGTDSLTTSGKLGGSAPSVRTLTSYSASKTITSMGSRSSLPT